MCVQGVQATEQLSREGNLLGKVTSQPAHPAHKDQLRPAAVRVVGASACPGRKHVGRVRPWRVRAPLDVRAPAAMHRPRLPDAVPRRRGQGVQRHVLAGEPGERVADAVRLEDLAARRAWPEQYPTLRKREYDRRSTPSDLPPLAQETDADHDRARREVRCRGDRGL